MPDAAAVTEYAAADAKTEVVARAEYAPEIQIPGGRYCFVYRIVIRNIGGAAYRLLSRQWRITDGDGNAREIRGEGVVGEQPRIVPGGDFAYSSYADLPTPAGSMSGAYTMRLESGEEFEAKIPRFSLFVPGKVH